MRVLFIDDDADLRKVGHLSLVGVGKFEADIAATAAEGLELARTNNPAVVLMDMMMPGIDGLTALRAMRALPDLCNVPVIFMTARVQKTDIQQYLAAGAIGVIEKPFDPMTLPALVRELMVDAGYTPT